MHARCAQTSTKAPPNCPTHSSRHELLGAPSHNQHLCKYLRHAHRNHRGDWLGDEVEDGRGRDGAVRLATCVCVCGKCDCTWRVCDNANRANLTLRRLAPQRPNKPSRSTLREVWLCCLFLSYKLATHHHNANAGGYHPHSPVDACSAYAHPSASMAGGGDRGNRMSPRTKFK